MGKRGKPYKPKPFESDGRSNDTSANIFHSMLISPQFKSLSKGAQALYVRCKDQLYTERPKPIPKYEELTESELQRCFTMPKSKWHDEYGLYNDNGNQFKKDMDELIKSGFIDIVENGKNTRTKSIYMLSNRWREKPP